VVGSYSLLAVVVSSAIVWHAGRLLVVVASLVCNVASVHDCLVLVYFGASTFLFMFSLWFIISAMVSVVLTMHCDCFPHKISA